MPKDASRLPAFKTYQESSYERFKKDFKLILLWSCFQWGALLIQCCFNIVIAMQYGHVYLTTDIVIFVLFFVAWMLTVVFLKLSVQKYKWYRYFDLVPVLGIILISAASLWRAKLGIPDHQSLDEETDFFQRFDEITFNLSCFLFLTSKIRVRIACFVIYVLYNIIVLAFIDLDFEWLDLLHNLLFYGFSSCAFGILSSAFHESHKRLLEEQKEFWRLSFEMIPHGVAIFDQDTSLIYHNQALISIVQECNETESSNVAQSEYSEKIMGLQIKLRTKAEAANSIINLQSSQAKTSEIAGFNDEASLRLDFKELMTQHVKDRAPFVPIFADCMVGSKTIEIKAQKSHFKGHGDFFMAIFVDVTYRDKLVQLEDQNLFKDLLFKSVSHELRGPLNGSMMSISSLLKQDLPKDCKEVLNMSLVCQSRLLKSIDGILDLVKINSKKFTPVLERFDLKEIIQNSIGFFEDIVQKKSITMKVQMFEDYPSPVMINSDPVRIEQILYQVIDNAIKFTPPHGSVFFSAKHLPLTPVGEEMHEEDKEDRIEITVEDSGCGLSQGEVAKICALPVTGFSRSKVSENSTGACLGLSLVTNLLTKLGSGFKIESEVTQGSRFSFKLKNFKTSSVIKSFENIDLRDVEDSPTKINTCKKLSEESSSLLFPSEIERVKSTSWIEKLAKNIPPASRGVFMKMQNEGLSPISLTLYRSGDNSPATVLEHNMKILIVDDDAFNIFALKRVLNQMHYQVLIAYNGHEAIETLQIHHSSVQLVIMDLNMPVMDGYVATRELKKLMRTKEMSDIPIVACTAYAQESERQMCFEIGFDEFLTKPLNPKKLEEVIARFGNKHLSK